jgi:Tfp pilus assembly protein PilN
VRAVNLMPRDERRARFEAGRLPLVAAAGGIVVVTALAFFVASSASGEASDHKAELQAIEAQIARLPQAGGAGVDVSVFAQERADRVAALSAALVSRTAFDRVLRDVSFVLPKHAWLTELDAAAPVTLLPAEGAVTLPQSTVPSGVTITGATYTHEDVAKVLGRLSVVPSLTAVRLTSTALVEPQAGADSGSGQDSKRKRTRSRPFVTFVISAGIKSAGSS